MRLSGFPPTLQHMVEQVPYRVIENYPGFEVRAYDAYALVSVDAPGDVEEASYRGFGPLFRYISGGNTANQKIAMTAPVFQETKAPTVHRISFAMPQGFTPSDIPTPDTPLLSIDQVPAHRAAALTFRGSWNAQRLEEKTADLRALMAKEGLSESGPPLFARYDPPYKPPVFRRNEVIIPVRDGAS